jgi:hypothetical protein
VAVLNRTSRKPTGHDPCVPGTPRPRPPAYLEQRAARHVTTPRAGSVLPETRAAAPLRDSSQLHSDRSPALETTTVPNRRIVSLCHAGRGSRRRHDVTCPRTAGAPVAVAAAPTNRGGASHVAPRGPHPLAPLPAAGDAWAGTSARRAAGTSPSPVLSSARARGGPRGHATTLDSDDLGREAGAWGTASSPLAFRPTSWPRPRPRPRGAPGPARRPCLFRRFCLYPNPAGVPFHCERSAG